MLVGESLPDMIALTRAFLIGDEEGIGLIFSEYGLDAKSGALVGELVGVVIGLADEVPGQTVDDLLDRLYEASFNETG